MRYILAIISVLIIIYGIFLFQNFSNKVRDYEGISGFEVDFKDTVTMDSYHISFHNNDYAEEVILYSWDGKKWLEESKIQNNQSWDVNLSNFKNSLISTRVLRIIFHKPHNYPIVKVIKSYPLYKNNIVNTECSIFPYHNTGKFVIVPNSFYTDKFTNNAQLLNLYFTTRPVVLLLYTVFLSLFLLLFFLVPGYVLASSIPNLSKMEKLCIAPVISLVILFFIGVGSLVFHRFALAYLYLLITGISIFIFIVKGYYSDLLRIPRLYYISTGLIFLFSLSISLFMNSISHHYMESENYMYRADYLIPYNFTQAFYYNLDYHSDLSSNLLFGKWHFSDRTPIIPCAAFPLLILLGNTFKVFELYYLVLICFFSLSMILVSQKWFDQKTTLLTCLFITLVPHIYVMGILFPFRIIMTYILFLSIYFIDRQDDYFSLTSVILSGFCGVTAYLVHPNVFSTLVGLTLFPLFVYKSKINKIKSFLIIAAFSGGGFILWNLWSKFYDRPSILYLYPLCMDNWLDVWKYSKEGIMDRFMASSFSEIVGNRIKSLYGLFDIFYRRSDFADRNNGFYRNTLTGSIMLSICIFSYINFALKFKRLFKQILFFIVIPLFIQLIGIGWFAPEMGVYITPIIFMLFLFGINLIARLNKTQILLINLLCVIESIVTVWVFHFDIFHNLFLHLNFLGLITVICITLVFILEIYFLFKTISNKSLYVSERTDL